MGEWTHIVRVIPGQNTKERLQGLEESFHEHDSLDGVVYVVDWGYTNVRDSIIREKLIKEEGIDTVEKLRNYNLKNELEDFKKLTELLQSAYHNKKGPKWLVIAVNKIDLYFDNVNEAQRYYHPECDSDFTKVLNELMLNIGKQNLKCVALPICSWEANFEWNKEKIKTELGGTEIGHALSTNFIKTLAEL
jgi:hypothetical protein